jgi:hypothetical protein
MFEAGLGQAGLENFTKIGDDLCNALRSTMVGPHDFAARAEALLRDFGNDIRPAEIAKRLLVGAARGGFPLGGGGSRRDPSLVLFERHGVEISASFRLGGRTEIAGNRPASAFHMLCGRAIESTFEVEDEGRGGPGRLRRTACRFRPQGRSWTTAEGTIGSLFTVSRPSAIIEIRLTEGIGPPLRYLTSGLAFPDVDDGLDGSKRQLLRRAAEVDLELYLSMAEVVISSNEPAQVFDLLSENYRSENTEQLQDLLVDLTRTHCPSTASQILAALELEQEEAECRDLRKHAWDSRMGLFVDLVLAAGDAETVLSLVGELSPKQEPIRLAAECIVDLWYQAEAETRAARLQGSGRSVVALHDGDVELVSCMLTGKNGDQIEERLAKSLGTTSSNSNLAEFRVARDALGDFPIVRRLLRKAALPIT